MQRTTAQAKDDTVLAVTISEQEMELAQLVSKGTRQQKTFDSDDLDQARTLNEKW